MRIFSKILDPVRPPLSALTPGPPFFDPCSELALAHLATSLSMVPLLDAFCNLHSGGIGSVCVPWHSDIISFHGKQSPPLKIFHNLLQARWFHYENQNPTTWKPLTAHMYTAASSKWYLMPIHVFKFIWLLAILQQMKCWDVEMRSDCPASCFMGFITFT